MALVKCPECGTSVSEFAPSCPTCGFRVGAVKEKQLEKQIRDCDNKEKQLNAEWSQLSVQLQYDKRMKEIDSEIAQISEMLLRKSKISSNGGNSVGIGWLLIGVLLVVAALVIVFCAYDYLLVALGLGWVGYLLIKVYVKDQEAGSLTSEEEAKKHARLEELRREKSNLNSKKNKISSEIARIRTIRSSAEKELERIGGTRSSSIPVDNKPRCPTCRSDNIERITELERYVDSTGFGTLAGGGLNSPSLGKTFKCNKCGYRW